MMMYLLMFVATVAIASAIPRMEFGRLIGGVSSGSYDEGETITITCTDQPSSVGFLNGLSLLRLRGLEMTGTVVYKMYVDWGNPDPLERWGRSDMRYSVDQKSLTASGAKFRIIIQNLDGNDDSAQYWCLAEGSRTGSMAGNMESQRQNLSIAATVVEAEHGSCSKSCCSQSNYCCVDHVSFGFRLGRNLTTRADVIVKFNQALAANAGNAYSAFTGVFSAPAAGLYNFQLTAYLDAITDAATPLACIYQNNAMRSCVTSRQIGTTLVHSSGTQMLPLQLKRGEQVYVVLKANTVMYALRGVHSTFSGFLIQPDCSENIQRV